MTYRLLASPHTHTPQSGSVERNFFSSARSSHWNVMHDVQRPVVREEKKYQTRR